ncbi:pilus assembly protein TadE [Gordonia sp. TBRC 11910]|uniref:Pilus assembly protein TadE n=2 Tax=Gordonia asplenii TaxID=2725283 RepID=A0A848KXE2_9ACTN|nr:pilus assembly protein TadE [Gordonia asplenii]
MSTVEAAYGIAAIIVVLVLGIVAVSAVSAQVRCVDAARETARLTAAGDANAKTVGTRVAPSGASITVDAAGDFIEVTVATRVALLPGVDIWARAVAAREPDESTEVAGRTDGAQPVP